MLAEVTNVIVGLHARRYGKGATRSKSYLLDDLLVCVMEDVYTTVERTLIDAGEADQVRATRQAFQDAMQAEFRSEVERVAGRRVVAFIGQVTIDPDIAVQIFVLEPSVDGAG
jgi:uncharacterized protein YbcI